MGKHAKRDRKRRARNRRYAGKAAFHGINWSYYKHHELYDMIMDAKPDVMNTRAQQWKTLGGAIENTTSEVRRTMDQLLTTWKGTAANSAQASNALLFDWATQASSAATGIGGSLDTYADAVSLAKRNMPEPEFAYSERAAMNGNDFKLVTGASREIQLQQLLDDQKPDFEKNKAAHAEAVRVMTTYGGQSQVVHDDMPDLPPSPPGRGAPPAVTYEEAPGPGPGPGGPGPGENPQGTGGTTIPGTTSAAGFADPSSARAGGGAGGPSLGGTGYGGGVGSLGSGGSDIARPGAGGFAGVGGGIAGRPGAAGMGGLGARGAGAGAFGGMPLGAGGAPGEEDQEHKNKYDEGLDLFDDLPPAYPPVFGA